MIRAAIFDMDGLLFDTERLCCDAWRTVASTAGYAMDDALFFKCVGRNNRDTKNLVMEELGPDFPYDDFNRDAKVWMQARMAENGPPEKPGIRTLFEFLKSRQMPIALATSTSEKSARWMIDRAGLTRYFTAFAFGSEVEHGKPAPDIFLLARDRIGSAWDSPRDESAAVPASLRSEECVVFEDSPAGLRAASAAGMKPVFIKDMVTPPAEVLALIWKEVASLDQAASETFFG